MQLIGLARLGKDAELRFTPNGQPVTNMSLAFNYGQKDGEGKRPTQWIEATLWGKLGEALIDYLTRGTKVCVTLDDPHMETYEGRNGTGHKLVAKVLSIELSEVAERQQGSGQSQAPAQRPSAPGNQPAQRQAAPRPAPAPAPKQGFDDMDGDIPF